MSILDLFAKSPFKPMQQHMDVVLQAVQQLTPLLDALVAHEPARLAEARSRIDTLEGEADRLKNDLRAHLPKRLLLPVDRRDLLEILNLQDTIADLCQDVAHLLVEREMPVPDAMREPLLQLASGVERTCTHSGLVISRLDELLELGFRGREAERVEHMIDELGMLEEETDRLESQLVRVIFQLEDEMSAVSVMLWYQLARWIGGMADCGEKVGNRVRLLIAS